MLRSSLLISCVLAGFTAIAPLDVALGQAKVGVVNFAQLADQSPQAKTMQATLEREFGTRQRDLLQQDKDLKAKVEKYQRDSAVMAQAERTKAEKELVDAQRDAKRRQDEFKEDVELRRNEELRKLQNSLLLEVRAYAKAQNFDMVLPLDALIYHKDAMDITGQVVSAMQAKSAPAAAPAAAPKP
jgi:outer membrane protein